MQKLLTLAAIALFGFFLIVMVLLLGECSLYSIDRPRYIVLSDNDDPAVAVNVKGKLYQVQYGVLKIALDRFDNQPHFYIYYNSDDTVTRVGQYIAFAHGDFSVSDDNGQGNPFYAGVIGPNDPGNYISEEKHYSNASQYQTVYRLRKAGAGGGFLDTLDGKYTRSIPQWECVHIYSGRTSCNVNFYEFTDISKIISLYGKTLTAYYDRKKNMVILSFSSTETNRSS